jgi:hypothetical protein
VHTLQHGIQPYPILGGAGGEWEEELGEETEG